MIGILGAGYSVPSHVRTNDDPLFDHIKRVVNSQGIAETDLFTGMKERRYLQEGESLEALMIEAGQQALQQARVEPTSIDRLYGYASVSPYLTPNALYAVHRGLGLPQHTMVVPINSEFSNFLLGVIHAWEAIALEHSSYALIACGTDWTRSMDYTQGHTLSVGDGAGAAVVGPDAQFALVDYAVSTLSEQYGVMAMKMRPVTIQRRQFRMKTHPVTIQGRRYLPIDGENIPRPTYEITPEGGIHSFQTAGMEGPPLLVQTLLKKHGLVGSDIALISHQASRLMLDYWAERLQPREYLETLEQFGNMTLATYPVNLAYFFQQITADYLVMVAVGVGFHQVALLLKRER